jgi:rubrerythrin
MTQEMKMEEAIKIAIQTEKDVMDFYLKAASLTNNERGKKVFEQLAKEEREHAEHFFKIYTGTDLGSFEDFISQPPSSGHAMLKMLEKALDENVHERKAMELAMQEEEDLVKSLRMTAGRIVDPGVRAVFERMAQETENHYAIIESEYAHMMGMVHESEIDTYVRE